MTGETKQEQALITSLIVAGCNTEQVDQFMKLLAEGKKETGLSLLEKHRRYLLDCYHADQKRIDCLDYLIYRLRG